MSEASGQIDTRVKRAALAAFALAAIRIIGAAGVLSAYAMKHGSLPPSGITTDLVMGAVWGAALLATGFGIKRGNRVWAVSAAILAIVLLLLRCLVTVFGASASLMIFAMAGPAFVLEIVLVIILLRGVMSLVPGWSRLDATKHCAIAVAILVVAGLGFEFFSNPAPELLALRKGLRDFPKAFAGYNGRFQVLTPEMEIAVGADDYLNLSMRSKGRTRNGLVYATYNAKAAGQIPHVPWVCMLAADYKLMGSRQTEIPLEGLSGRAVAASALKDRPWMCVVSVGPTLFISSPTRGISVNLLEFQKENERGQRQRVMMLQYFNVGGYYTPSRQVARFQAWWGGGYLAQTQIAIWLTPSEAMTLPPLDAQAAPSLKAEVKNPVYKELLRLLQYVAPRMEEHLPERKIAS